MIPRRGGPTGEAAPQRRHGSSRTAVSVLLLFLVGLVVNLYYGRIGFMPLDQGIVFDGAWRLMNGQVPFKDFAAPNALVPSLMQVPLFRALGVTWFAFVLHASIVNGLFCVLVYLLLRTCGAIDVEAALYAALSAFFFYPPNGTPFMDQHAFFFVALMLGAVVAGMVAPTPALERAAWVLVPVFFALAYLSKQIPTAFAALCVAAWVLIHPRAARRWIGPVVAGVALLGVAAVLLRWWLGFSPMQALTYLVVMPLDVGAERTTGEGDTAALNMVFGTLRRLPADAHRWSMYLPLAGMAAFAAGHRANPRWPIDLWLLTSVFFTTGAFVAYTINQIENAFSLLMLAAGLSSVAIRQAASHFGGVRWGRRLAAGLTAAIAVATVADTVAFARSVDATRVVLDTEYDPALADRAAPHLPEALRFLRWTEAELEPEEFGALVRTLRDADGEFALVSDLTPLYALTGKRSISPALWLHSGLSVPRPGTPAFSAFDAELLRRIEAGNVRRVVVSPRTLRGFSLSSFPGLDALVRDRNCGERRFGLIRVISLCPR
jgi:hypothetical protein